MIIELLTPLLISTAPMIVTVASADKYSHETQVVARAKDEDTLQYTASGTQTFDYRGKPSDSDND